jgi:chromosome segregation ATPase
MDDDLEALCDRYELLWRRAREGAASANKAIGRLQARVDFLKTEVEELEDELAVTQSRLSRANRENEQLEKKVQRLSLKILELWSRE